ncbi:MAG TPA: hypothetical protein VGA61_13505 [Anaerolineae bacterium]
MATRGSRRARIREAHLRDDYGLRCWEIVYTIEESPGEIRRMRIATEQIYDSPKPGDTVIIVLVNGKPSVVYQTD